MLNKYCITLIAGTRINGVAKANSSKELEMHTTSLAWLKDLLGDNLEYYCDSTGFIIANITTDQVEAIESDYRVYRVTKIEEPTICANFSSYSSNTWYMPMLSNNIYIGSNRPIQGFKLELGQRMYGYFPADYYYVNRIIKTSTIINKYWYNNKLYNLEISDKILINLDNVEHSNINTPGTYTIVYNINTYRFELILQPIGNELILGTVDVFVEDNYIVRYYNNNMAVYGLSNLKQIGLNTNYTQPLDGTNVEVIIGDAHINYNLTELEGRASLLYNPYITVTDAYYGDLDTGYASHGTLVATLIAGKTYGVAKNASIKGVTLFDYSEGEKPDGTSTLSSNKTVEGILYIASYITAQKALNPSKAIIVNLSLNFSTMIAEVNDAVASMITDGATVIIAAGNNNSINTTSPYANGAIIVAACDSDLIPLSDSNYGPNITIYAPGSGIESLMNSGDLHIWSGTSAAAPIVAGVCANYMSLHLEATPSEIKTSLVANAIPAITYNKLYTTDLFVQNIDFGYTTNSLFNSNDLKPDTLLCLEAYVLNHDNSKFLSNRFEIALDNIANIAISAGKLESTNIGTVFTLQR